MAQEDSEMTPIIRQYGPAACPPGDFGDMRVVNSPAGYVFALRVAKEFQTSVCRELMHAITRVALLQPRKTPDSSAMPCERAGFSRWQRHREESEPRRPAYPSRSIRRATRWYRKKQALPGPPVAFLFNQTAEVHIGDFGTLPRRSGDEPLAPADQHR